MIRKKAKIIIAVAIGMDVIVNITVIAMTTALLILSNCKALFFAFHKARKMRHTVNKNGGETLCLQFCNIF